MKQQINLYQEQFYEKRIRFPALHMFLLTLLSVFFIAGGSIWLKISNQEARDRNAKLLSDVAVLTVEVDAMKARIQTQTVHAGLLAAVADANRQIVLKERLLSMVDVSTHGGIASRFSALMEGLARRHVEGMWLVRVDIRKGGQELLFEGSTLDAALLPVFIGRLHDEEAYAGREFKTIIMHRNEEHAQKIDFVLGTSIITEEERLSKKLLSPQLTLR